MSRIHAAVLTTPVALLFVAAALAAAPGSAAAADPTPGEIAREGLFGVRCVEDPYVEFEEDGLAETCVSVDHSSATRQPWTATGTNTLYRFAADGSRAVDFRYNATAFLEFNGVPAPALGQSLNGTSSMNMLVDVQPDVPFRMYVYGQREVNFRPVQVFSANSVGVFTAVPQWPTYGTETCSVQKIPSGRLNICLYSGVRAQLDVTAEKRVQGKWVANPDLRLGFSSLVNIMDGAPNGEVSGAPAAGELREVSDYPYGWDPAVEHEVQAKATVTYRLPRGVTRSVNVATPVGIRPAS